MRTQTRSGFTIIEVMLFLAITGALTAGILVGTGVAISQQRYRDSVNSFKAHIQEQYGQIANVINSETRNPICSRSGDTVVFDEDDMQARGTSECLIMGRFLLVEEMVVTSYNLVGQSTTATSGSDVTALNDYAFALESPDTYPISWKSRIVEPESDEGSLTSILIVRSPLSGGILTYVLDGDHRDSVAEMIADTNMVEKNFCVDSGGGSAMVNRMAVRINARAANQSAIEIPLESEHVCG